MHYCVDYQPSAALIILEPSFLRFFCNCVLILIHLKDSFDVQLDFVEGSGFHRTRVGRAGPAYVHSLTKDLPINTH